ncbi:hypothetical protein ABVK25_010459 [Lepraria finkii]|uniref:Uncharacterized protein n=1 Tax=Lepraria finkii TaxID=1340010 RepID=A0ABR4AWT7_9LECA
MTNLYCSLGSDNYVGSCTDRNWDSPACPFSLDSSRFNSTLNTTTCNDGSICPSAKNETCCHNHQGIKEIKFHNNNPLPSKEADLATYYSVAGFSISTSTLASTPNTQTTLATTLSTRQSTPSASSAAATTAAPTTTSLPSGGSSGINPGTIAGIGIGAAVCIWLIACLIYFWFNNRGTRSSRRWYGNNRKAASKREKLGEKYYQVRSV